MTEKTVDIVFDGPPSHDAPRFVEVERDGKSIKYGEWVRRDDGYWVLRVPDNDDCHSLYVGAYPDFIYGSTKGEMP